MSRFILLCCFLCLAGLGFSRPLSNPSFTATSNKDAPVWSGNAQLGYLGNTGNTQSKNVDGAFQLKYNKNHWEHLLNFTGQYASDKNKSTAERITESLQSRYYFTEKEVDFLFGWVNGVQDQFATYSPVLAYAAGYGWRVLTTKTMFMDFQLGPGERLSTIRGTGRKQNEFIVFGNVHYHWQFNEKTSFDQNVLTEYGGINQYYSSISSIKTNLIGSFGLVLSYNVRYNSDIPKGSKNRHHYDTTTSVNLIYTF